VRFAYKANLKFRPKNKQLFFGLKGALVEIEAIAVIE
jgi:hypothetical protein